LEWPVALWLQYGGNAFGRYGRNAAGTVSGACAFSVKSVVKLAIPLRYSQPEDAKLINISFTFDFFVTLHVH